MHISLRRTLVPLILSLPMLLLLAGCPQDTKPDIQAGSMSVLPAAPVPTQPAVVSLPITNTGDKNAGQFAWTVRRDGAYNFATGTVPGLAKGASTTISFTVLEATASTHTYQVILNSNNDFSEFDLENNTVTAAIGFGPTAVDPQVTQLLMTTPASGDPTGGELVTLTATVVSPLDAINVITDLQWTLTGVAVNDSDASDTFTTTPIPGTIASIAIGQSINLPIGIGSLDDRFFYTFTFTITTGVTNTDTNPANNSASSISISPTPSARAALSPETAPLIFHLSQR